MRNGKKWLAVATALCMVVPSMTAFADETGATGSGSLEYDSKEVKDFYHVVLPTITESTYGFTLDPTGILNDYDPTNYAGGSVYFTKTGTPAALSNKEDGTATDQKLYVVEYKVLAGSGTGGVATAAEIKAALTAAATAATEDDGVTAWAPANTTYCVWGPVANDLPNGEYVELTLANVNEYCTVTDNAGTAEVDFRADNNVLDTDKPVFDKVLYEKVYTDINTLTYDVLDYVTVDANGTVTGLKDNGKTLYVMDTTGANPTPTAITASDYSTYLEYTKAVPAYAGTSDTVKIVNKSNKQQTVTAKITVTNADGLNFVGTPLTGSETVATADINMELSYDVDASGTPIKEYVANTAASGDPATYGVEFTVALNGADDPDTDYNVYRGGIDPATKGHKYERYMKSDMDYSEVDFTFTATIATNNQAEPAWKAYAQALKDAYEADGVAKTPSIDVVYEITGGASSAVQLPAGDWDAGYLWFGDGHFTDQDKWNAATITVVNTVDGSTGTLAPSDLTLASGYAAITWVTLTDVGDHDGSGNFTIRIVYDGETYEMTMSASNP